MRAVCLIPDCGEVVISNHSDMNAMFVHDNETQRDVTLNNFSKKIVSYLRLHQNHLVRDAFRENPILTERLSSLGHTSFGSSLGTHMTVAVDNNNIQGLCILLENKFILYNYNHPPNPIVNAISLNDFNTVSLLLSLGARHSCADCSECGLPETCNLLRVMSGTSLDTLRVLLNGNVTSFSVSNALKMYSEDNKFKHVNALDILDVIEEYEIPIDIVKISVNNYNKEFVSILLKKGYINPTTMSHYTFSKMVPNYFFGVRNGPIFRDQINLVKACLDLGADIEEKMKIRRNFYLDSLPLEENNEWVHVSFRTIITEMVKTTKDMVLWEKLSNEFILFDAAVLEIRKHIGFRDRLDFLRYRTSENIQLVESEEAYSIFEFVCGVDGGIFGKIMSFYS